MALSGGSTPKVMFEWMAKQQFDWSQVHIFWVDERAVPPDHEQSNFRMTKAALIDPAGIPAANVHRIQSELEPARAARVFESEMLDVFGLAPENVPVFDVIHLGMGSDAHTASLFPGEPLINDLHAVSAAVYVAKLNMWRITLLPAVLLAARNVAVLACGPDKNAAIGRVFSGDEDLNSYPAQLLRTAPQTLWFLDEPAACQITSFL